MGEAEMTATVTPIAPRYTKASTLLKIDHVALKFGERVIFNDINAQIDDIVRPDCVTGQVVCFLGPSGIGKTQLSRIIAGLQKPTAGGVYLDTGRRLPAPSNAQIMAPVHKGAVGMVPQNYPLFEFATVAENLAIAGKMAGLPPAHAKEKADQFLADFELGSHANDYPAALSGGTRQRVAIVRQLMCAEHFLVMDEPFSGLDPIMKAKACSVITQVANRDEANTIIVVTHDIAEGLSVADTVWLMGKDKVSGVGATLVQQIDLAAEDLCWRPDIKQDPRFQKLVADVRGAFATLV